MSENQENPTKSESTPLTAEFLTELVTALKTPVLTERQQQEEEKVKRAEAQAAAERRIQADFKLQEIENKKREQAACSHKHRQGQTHCVFIANGNYILCQKCQKITRPETEPELFNRLFQTTTTELFG